MTETPKPMPLAKFLSKAGVASRRASEKLIAAGEVEVNSVVTTALTTRVVPGTDVVCYQGKVLQFSVCKYYVLHKPKGYTCSAADPHADKLAIELVPIAEDEHLYSVGRLDMQSEGLLIFTNDGELSHRLTHPRFEIHKTYVVDVKGKPTPDKLARMCDGIQDGDDFLQAKSAKMLSWDGRRAQLEVIVAEGKKHEIRRLCRGVGHIVKVLLRTRMGPLNLGKYQPGLCRELTSNEINALKQATGLA